MKIEQDLLERIQQGQLHVDHATGVVSCYHRGRKRWYPKKSDQHPVSGRQRFRFGPKRDTVYRNRLVWMYFNRRQIPEGCVVDHKDGDVQNDHPDNLRLMSRNESYRQGNERQVDGAFVEVRDYFSAMDFLR